MLTRLNKFIAENSEYSRRKADDLIANGKVKINGKLCKEMGTKVNPESDSVEINNQKIARKKIEHIYIALNKPAGHITTRNDEFNRPTVMKFVPKNKNLKAVGRLDKDTEGLLLFSNDGEFINRLTHPRYECEKEYFAILKGKLTLNIKEKLEKGILLEGKKTAPAKIEILKLEEAKTELKITIHEGRKRQIRKMFDYAKTPVKYLRRIRIGNIHLGSLALGEFRALTKEEINAD